jgi:hypothetical protein
MKAVLQRKVTPFVARLSCASKKYCDPMVAWFWTPNGLRHVRVQASSPNYT